MAIAASVIDQARVLMIRLPLAGTTTLYHTSWALGPQVGAATPECVALFTVPGYCKHVSVTHNGIAYMGPSFHGCAWIFECAKPAKRTVASRAPITDRIDPVIARVG